MVVVSIRVEGESVDAVVQAMGRFWSEGPTAVRLSSPVAPVARDLTQLSVPERNQCIWREHRAGAMPKELAVKYGLRTSAAVSSIISTLRNKGWE